MTLGDAMKFEQDKRRFDFHDIGLAIKRAREASGMTQEQLAYIVDRSPRTIVFIDVMKNPVISMLFPFLLVSSHISVQVGFVRLGTILAPQTRQYTEA